MQSSNKSPVKNNPQPFHPEALALSAATKKLQYRLQLFLPPILLSAAIFVILFAYEYSVIASATLSETSPSTEITVPSHNLRFWSAKSRTPFLLTLDGTSTPIAEPSGQKRSPSRDVANQPRLPQTITPTVPSPHSTTTPILPTTITLTQTHLTLSHPTDPSSPPTPIATLPVHSYLGIRPIAYLEDQTPDGRYAIIRINYRLYLVDTIQRAAALVVENGWKAKFVEQGE